MPLLILYLAGSAVLGAVLCFAGRRYYAPLLGVLTFFSVCTARSAQININTGTVLAALAAGLLTALCARFFYKVGVFLTCALIGAGLGAVLTAAVPTISGGALLSAVLAVAGGVLSLFWSDVLLMVSTAFSGAALLAAPLCLLLFERSYLADLTSESQGMAAVTRLKTYLFGSFTDTHAFVLLLFTAALAVAGMVRQAASDRRRRGRDK